MVFAPGCFLFTTLINGLWFLPAGRIGYHHHHHHHCDQPIWLCEGVGAIYRTPPPLRRQMRPSPVRSGSNRPSRSQASHFQSLPKAGLQIKSLHANQMPNIDLLLSSGFPTSQSQTERGWYLSLSWSK